MEYQDPHDAQAQIANFWEVVRMEVDATKADQSVFKSQELPLARIKKIMKLDDEVKCMMISAEAPILFAKAAELFIRELTLRAWIHTERNRRRTLHRNDIALAVSDGDTDQFDFLIDIVPRDDSRSHRRNTHNTSGMNTSSAGSIGETVTVDSSKLASILEGHNIVDISNQAGNEAIILNGNGTTTATTNGGTGTQAVQFITSNSQNQNGSAANGQQVQYVLQLPSNSTGNSNQPFQIQMVGGGGIQDVNSLANGLPPGTVLQQGPNGSLQLVQFISSANSITTQSPAQNNTSNGDSTTVNGTSNDESENSQQNQEQSEEKMVDTQNTEEIDTKINIQLSEAGESSNNQTIIVQSGTDSVVSNDPLSQQQLIYTPIGSNQPVIISLADAIASGLVREMSADQIEQNPSNNVESTVEISSSNVEADQEENNAEPVQDQMTEEQTNEEQQSSDQQDITQDILDDIEEVNNKKTPVQSPQGVSDTNENAEPSISNEEGSENNLKEIEPAEKIVKVDEDTAAEQSNKDD